MNLLVILSFLTIFVHNPTEKTDGEKSVKKAVVWEESKKLTWSDFKGSPKTGSEFAAECYWEIKYSYSFNPHKNNLLFDVYCYFNSSKSWVKPSDRSEGLLQHEQVHFDIAELCSRKLRKKLAESSFQRATFKEEINLVFDDILLQCDSIQRAYDEQTNHGLIKKQQTAWIKRVNEDLKSLDQYKYNPDTNIESLLVEQNFISKLFRRLSF